MCTQQECIKNLLINLKCIGKIGVGYKLNTKGSYLALDDTTSIQGCRRWYRGDSRHAAIAKIRDVVHSALNLVDECLKEQDRGEKNEVNFCQKYLRSDTISFLETFMHELEKTKIGLRNLKNTYYNDTYIDSELEIHMWHINDKIKLINNFLQKIYEKNKDNEEEIVLQDQNNILFFKD